MIAAHTKQQLCRQRGAVLLIGMIFLLILMIGATSLMSATVMDERMTGNAKAYTEAFFAAEAGQREAWDELTSDSDAGYSKWKGLYAQVKSLSPDEPDAAVSVKSGSHNETGGSFEVKARYLRDSAGNIVPNRMQILSEGRQGRASRTIIMDLDGHPATPVPPLPFTIGCFGACIIEAGAANEAPISGLDHPYPPENCSGQACWTDPKDPTKAAVPAVYLSDFDHSDVELQGNGKGNNKLAFTGLSRFNADAENNTEVASGKDKNSGAVWGSVHYPVDGDGNSTAPQDTDYIGANAPLMKEVYEASQNATPALGSLSSPKISRLNPSTDQFNMSGSTAGGVLVIEGTDADGNPALLSHRGTGAYVGLIVIRDCNQVNFGGNFSVYGTIMVDASDCPDGYKPFFGNGTPDVKYSADALNEIASGALGSGVAIADWYELVND